MEDKFSIPLEEFKERELEIINLMADGLSNQEIADQLFITKATVRWYNKQIYSKLGTSRRTEAIALAREVGLIRDEESGITFNNLPVTSGTFWGRNPEIKQLVSQIDQSQTRLISLVAPGGMGKTRLATELAHQIAEAYSDGVYFIDLSPLHDANNIIPLLIELFELQSSAKTPMKPILDFCRDKKLLLLFDNFETVMSGLDYLIEIIEAAQHVKIIVTSRERLNHVHETVYRVKPLQRDTEKLFIEMAQRRVADFAATESDMPHITQICKLVDGLPLAIILAAAWVDVLSVAEIVEEIKNDLDFLEDELTNLPHRQRSIRAVLEQSWRRLTAQEQTSFIRLSVFRGGFNRQAARAVTDTDIHTLQALFGKSLIQRKVAGRLDLHPIIREFAYEQLVSHEPSHNTHKKHAHFYLTFAKTQEDELLTEHHLQARQSISIEFDNVTAAIDFAFEHADYKLLWKLLFHSQRVHDVTQQYELFVRHIKRTLPHIDDVAEKASLLAKLGYVLPFVAQSSEAKQVLEQALGLLRQIHHPDKALLIEQAKILNELTANASRVGDFDIARDYNTEAMSILQEHNLETQLDVVFAELGNIESRTGHYELAEQHLLNSIALAQKSKSVSRIALYHSHLGILYDHMGLFEKAAASYKHYLNFAREANDASRIFIPLSNLGLNAERQGNYEEAYKYYQEALNIIERRGYQPAISALAINMGFVALHYQQIDEAYDNLVEGIRIAQELQFVTFTLEALAGLAMIAYQKSDYIYSATLIEFIETHEARNADIDARLNEINFDFESMINAEQRQAVKDEAAQLDLETVTRKLSAIEA